MTEEEACAKFGVEDACWLDESEHLEAVPGTHEIVDQGRWDTTKTEVFRDKRDGKFYRLTWSVGSTEYQEGHGFCACEEVFPVEKTVVVYE